MMPFQSGDRVQLLDSKGRDVPCMVGTVRYVWVSNQVARVLFDVWPASEAPGGARTCGFEQLRKLGNLERLGELAEGLEEACSDQ